MGASPLGDLRGELKELSRERAVALEGEEKLLERFRLTVMVNNWNEEWQIGAFR